MKDKKKFTALAFLLHFFILIVAAIEVYPLILMVFGSLKSTAELASNPAGVPLAPTLANYTKLLIYSGDQLFRSIFNSVYVSSVCTALTLFISSLAAFAFAKCKFKGKNIIFAALIATMIIPMELTIPPLYIVFSRINWLNSYYVQIFPFIANTFALFMIRQFMHTVPDSIIEAAHIDGAGLTHIFFSIMLPCSTPVLSVLGILVFLGRWNEYLWPAIMINNSKYAPVMQILPTLGQGIEFKGTANVPWEIVLAGCTLVTIPVIIIFLIFQDKFMNTVTIGAVKG